MSLNHKGSLAARTTCTVQSLDVQTSPPRVAGSWERAAVRCFCLIVPFACGFCPSACLLSILSESPCCVLCSCRLGPGLFPHSSFAWVCICGLLGLFLLVLRLSSFSFCGCSSQSHLVRVVVFSDAFSEHTCSHFFRRPPLCSIYVVFICPCRSLRTLPLWRCRACVGTRTRGSPRLQRSQVG